MPENQDAQILEKIALLIELNKNELESMPEIYDDVDADDPFGVFLDNDSETIS